MIKQKKIDRVLTRKIIGKFGKAIHIFNLIEEGDKIIVGVSGGKDSLALLQLLSQRRQFSDVNYEIVAVHVKVEELPYKVDREWLNNFCDSLGIEMIYKHIEVDFEREGKQPACFRCSWNRRTALFKLADELGCNKLALGHHMDDALETLLMNMMHQANISSMPAKLDMFGGKLQLIRPLMLLTNAEMKEFSRINNFVLEKVLCPHEDMTQRKATSKILDALSDMNPLAKLNMFRSMTNIDLDYLPSLPDGEEW